MARKRRNRQFRRNNNSTVGASDRLGYMGPSAGPSGRAQAQPPKYLSNLVVTKVFRFVSTGGADGTAYTISAAKLCSLIAIATTTTSLVQLFEAVQIKWIKMWSSADQSSGIFLPRTIACEFSGTAAGVYGPQAKASDMSVGATRVGKLMIRPPRVSQAAQWQSGSTSSPPLFFTLTAGQGAIVDICLNLTVTGDSRATNNSVTINGPATVGQVYWLALDNNAGGNLSTANVWSPMPELITIT
jgi:hypothetical protein